MYSHVIIVFEVVWQPSIETVKNRQTRQTKHVCSPIVKFEFLSQLL